MKSANDSRSSSPRSGSVFLDTSLLLEALIGLKPAGAGRRIWIAIAEGRHPRALTAWHCCLEFYSVATRLPEEFRLAPVDCLSLLEEQILAQLDVHDLPGQARRSLLQTVAAEAIAGGRVYDAHIGEVARLAGASIVVTQNRRHFTSLLRHAVRVLSGDEYAAELGLA
jgi:predicted nucleic acid-binding protein